LSFKFLLFQEVDFVVNKEFSIREQVKRLISERHERAKLSAERKREAKRLKKLEEEGKGEEEQDLQENSLETTNPKSQDLEKKLESKRQEVPYGDEQTLQTHQELQDHPKK